MVYPKYVIGKENEFSISRKSFKHHCDNNDMNFSMCGGVKIELLMGFATSFGIFAYEDNVLLFWLRNLRMNKTSCETGKGIFCENRGEKK